MTPREVDTPPGLTVTGVEPDEVVLDLDSTASSAPEPAVDAGAAVEHPRIRPAR